MEQPKGYLVDVPVTLTVAVRGATRAESQRIARDFAQNINTDFYRENYSANLKEGVSIPEVSLVSSTEESTEVLEELEPKDDEASAMRDSAVADAEVIAGFPAAAAVSGLLNSDVSDKGKKAMLTVRASEGLQERQ